MYYENVLYFLLAAFLFTCLLFENENFIKQNNTFSLLTSFLLGPMGFINEVCSLLNGM